MLGEAITAAIPLSIALAVGVGLFAWLQAEASVAIAAAASFIGLQLQLTTRRALLAAGRFGACVIGDGLAYVAGVAAIAGVAGWHGIDLAAVFAIQSLAYVTSVAIAAWLSGARVPARPGRGVAFIVGNWRVSAPTLGCSVIDALTAQLGLYAVALLCGNAEAALFAAAVVPTGVLNPLGAAMVNTMMPRVSAASRISSHEARKTAVAVAALYGAPFALLLALLWTWSGPALAAVSGKAAHYAGAGEVVRWLCLANGSLFCFWCVQSFLLALGRSRLALVMQFGRLAGMVVFSLVLVGAHGAVGAAQAAAAAGLTGLAAVMLTREGRVHAGRRLGRA